MIHTEICDLLGIEYPIFQGGMAWVSDASLAGAVSNAGGQHRDLYDRGGPSRSTASGRGVCDYRCRCGGVPSH